MGGSTEAAASGRAGAAGGSIGAAAGEIEAGGGCTCWRYAQEAIIKWLL
jgi:hypothetical protein